MKEGGKKEYGRNLPQWLKALIFAMLATVIIISLKECVTGSKSKAGTLTEIQQKRTNDAWNKSAIDSCIKLLKQGDVVVRSGRDITSQMFMKFNQKDKTYSHCGIVMIENGYPFIYHAIGGEDNPDAKLRRDSASFWFSTVHNLGLGICRFDLTTQQHDSLTAVVKKFYKERRMFDMDFDLKTDDRLYCAEFVYKAMNKATGDNDYLKPVTLFGYRLIAVDNLYKNDHARLVCQVRYK
jgi:hypothetical protein